MATHLQIFHLKSNHEKDNAISCKFTVSAKPTSWSTNALKITISDGITVNCRAWYLPTSWSTVQVPHMLISGTTITGQYFKESFLPHVRTFGEPLGDTSCFIDDNAPCHPTATMQDYLDSKDIHSLVS